MLTRKRALAALAMAALFALGLHASAAEPAQTVVTVEAMH